MNNNFVLAFLVVAPIVASCTQVFRNGDADRNSSGTAMGARERQDIETEILADTVMAVALFEAPVIGPSQRDFVPANISFPEMNVLQEFWRAEENWNEPAEQ